MDRNGAISFAFSYAALAVQHLHLTARPKPQAGAALFTVRRPPIPQLEAGVGIGGGDLRTRIEGLD